MKTRLYLPFQQKKNEVISLRSLKDMINKYHVQFSFSTSIKRSCQYFFCNFRKSAHDHNYWLYPDTTVKQSGYCSRCSPLFNAY